MAKQTERKRKEEMPRQQEFRNSIKAEGWNENESRIRNHPGSASHFKQRFPICIQFIPPVNEYSQP